MSENKPLEGKKRGSVLVLGGGIGGMQTSLDLADSGFKVHMVTKDQSIGGIMSRLDKTFPTGDCAMCMISPKMVEVGRHNNIDILSMSEVVSIEGEPGNFRIKIRRKARGVDPSKCTGCGECTRACPVHNIIQVPERPAPPALKPEWRELLDRVAAKYGAEKSSLISMLQEVNHSLNYLPLEMLAHIAAKLEIPESHVLSVATFYNAFSLVPVGRHIIEICSGTACHVKGAGRLIDQLKDSLQVEPGHTTADERFTLRTVNCIGCCALAPAMKVDGEVYGYVKVSELKGILNDHP